MNGNINKKINTAASWSSLTEIIARLISPIVNMILARLLVPEAFGIIATINMVISFAELFTDAGFQKYLIQHEFPDEAALEKNTNVAFWTNLAVSVVICAGIFLFRHPIAALTGNPELGNSIGVASLLIIIAAFSSIQTARYRRALDFKTFFYVRIVTSLIPLVVTVPLAWVLRNYRALLIGTFCSHLSNAVILTVRSAWKPKFYYSISLLREMFSFSVWTLLESISIWLTAYIDIFIVGNYLNAHWLGIYKTSMSTVNSYLAIITGALTPVLFSALSRYQNDEINYRKTYYSFQRLTALFVLPMGVGIFVYRDFVTQILLGSQWTEAGEFIGLWGLTGAFSIIFAQFSSEVYRSSGNPKISLSMQVLHLAFLIPTLLLSIPHGYEAVCISRSLVRIQGMVSALLVLCFVYHFSPIVMFRGLAPMIGSAFIMGAAGYVLRPLSPSLLWQIVSILLCIVIYFTVLLLFLEKNKKEIIQLVKTFLKGKK